jgi:hypothetical protein
MSIKLSIDFTSLHPGYRILCTIVTVLQQEVVDMHQTLLYMLVSTTNTRIFWALELVTATRELAGQGSQIKEARIGARKYEKNDGNAHHSTWQAPC